MTDLYYLIPIGVLAGTNLWTVMLCRDHAKRLRWFIISREDYRKRLAAADRKLNHIKLKRHFSAKHARAAQIAKAKALRDAITTQLAGEVQAKARELRVAA